MSWWVEDATLGRRGDAWKFAEAGKLAESPVGLQ